MALVAGGLFLLSTVATRAADAGSTVVAMILLGIGIGISFRWRRSWCRARVAKEMIGVGTSQMQFWR
ncbi:hypothetical protein GCM10018966_075030 [Streptomyces yanii]